jgi:hypothetical protein
VKKCKTMADMTRTRIEKIILFCLPAVVAQLFRNHAKLHFSGVIVATASLLSLGLRKIRQPKVIAEVIGGIILGPSSLLFLHFRRNADLLNTQVPPHLVRAFHRSNIPC